jgi:hypothetical protein
MEPSKKIPREEMSRIIDSLITELSPVQYHAGLVKAFARGQHGVGRVSFKALQAEGHYASKTDPERAGRLAEYVTAVALTEAMACGLCDTESDTETLETAVATATYLLDRECPVSRILSSNGASICDQHLQGRKPWVDAEVFFSTFVVLMDGHTPVLPASPAQAGYLVENNYKALQPQLFHAIRKHIDEGSDASWWSLTSAHARAVADAAVTYGMRTTLFGMVSTKVDSFIEFARKSPGSAAVPGFEAGGDDQLVIKGFAKRAYELSDMLANAKWEAIV